VIRKAKTLGDLIDLYRPHLLDETVGVHRSWEDTFRYTLKVYPKNTPLEAFTSITWPSNCKRSG
jgi:hypothetical protein